MNARQKAKKYKRMYEALLKSPIEFEVKQYKIDTVKFERFYPAPVITPESSDFYREAITKDIARNLASELDKYINYNIEFCPHMNMYRFYGEIEVVNRL